MDITLIEPFERTVAGRPNDIAVRHAGETVAFAALRRRAQGLASGMLEEGIPLNTPVAVFLPKGIDIAVADIACMYSGNPFMNLDVKTPYERIHNILERVKPSLVLTSAEFESGIRSVAGKIPVVVVHDNEDELSPIAEVALQERVSQLIDTDPVCIINTSGSTGTPKGVILNHRSFFDFLAWAVDKFDFDGSEIIGALSPVVFDIYDFELFLMMTKGSSIVMLDAAQAAFPARLLQDVKQAGITFLFWVPSIMVSIANMDLLEKIDLSQLKTVWFAGEVFPTKQFNYWKRCLPRTLFANLYGPIEITLDCTCFIVDRDIPDSEPLPIGKPCRNSDVLILNDDDRPCEVGEKGELCVRGTSLAMGYYNNPEKTAAAFVQNPLNQSYPELIYRTGDVVYKDEEGLIRFKGRKDSLVKHMGYRIELGEIEHIVVNTLKLTKYCCVVYDFADKEIVLFYEASEDFKVPEVRKAMTEVIPKYMIPTQFVRMQELPRNTNGKIDRLLLASQVTE